MSNTQQLPQSKLTRKQVKTFTKKGVMLDGEKVDITTNVRYDDECGNGHNTFAITADVYRAGRRGDNNMIMCGCCHEAVAEAFPELAHLIKWHLVSSEGPLHYVANTMYHARDTDHYGKRKGEPTHFSRRLKFGDFPITIKIGQKFLAWLEKLEHFDLEIVSVPHKDDPKTFKPKYTFLGFLGEWYQCPFDTEEEALEFREALQNYPFEVVEIPTSFSDGKEPDLKAARSCAVWPEAELKDFTEENLKARLPALLEEFKKDVESLGFEY